MPQDHDPRAVPWNPTARWLVSLLVIVLVFAAVVWTFRYRDVAAEADLDHVAFTVLYGHRSGLGLSGGYPYGPSLSFGYYAALDRLLPDSVLSDPTRLVRALNLAGNVSSLFLIFFLGLFVGLLHGGTAGLIAPVLVGFSPMFLELACGSHPALPSTALLLLAGIAIVMAERSRHAGFAWWTLAALILLASLTVRAEVALAFPWLAFVATAPWTTREGRITWLRRWSVLALSVAGLLVLQRFEVKSGGGAAVASYMAEFHRLDSVAKGFPLFGLAFGPVAALALVGALGSALRDARARLLPLLGPSLMFAIGMAFWLPNPTPTRHFLYPILGAAVLIGVWLARRFSTRVAVTVAIALVACSQLVSEALYPWIVARYPWNYPPHGERRATPAVPLGFWVQSHRAVERQRQDLLQEALAMKDVSAPDVLVLADASYLMMLQLCAGPTSCVVEEGRIAGIPSLELRRGDQRFLFVRKNSRWPKDVLGEILASDPLPTARIYVQPSTRSRFDRVEPPRERELRLAPATSGPSSQHHRPSGQPATVTGEPDHVDAG